MKKRIYLDKMENQDALRAVIIELAKFHFSSSLPFFPNKKALDKMLRAHVSSELRIAFKAIWDFCQQDCWQGELFWEKAMDYKIVPESIFFEEPQKGIFHYTENNIACMASNIFRGSFPNEKQSEHIGIMPDIKLKNIETGHYVLKDGSEIAVGFFWGAVKGDILQTILDFVENYIPAHLREISSVSIHSGIVFSEKVAPERNAVIEFAASKGLPASGWIEK